MFETKVGFACNRLVIIESLESDEIQTGHILYETLCGIVCDSPVQIAIEHRKCRFASELLEILSELCMEAERSGNIPIVHIETHGHPIAGLEFSNGSILSWEQLAQAMLRLNIATKFNLVAVFAACFGAQFLDEMRMIAPAPCYALVGPSNVIDPGELQGGFIRFYRALLHAGDLGRAKDVLQRENLDRGYWIVQNAEGWYAEILDNFAKKNCSSASKRDWIESIQSKLSGRREKTQIKAIRKQLNLIISYYFRCHIFRTFFLTRDIPDNLERFSDVRKWVAGKHGYSVSLQDNYLPDKNEYLTSVLGIQIDIEQRIR